MNKEGQNDSRTLTRRDLIKGWIGLAAGATTAAIDKKFPIGSEAEAKNGELDNENISPDVEKSRNLESVEFADPEFQRTWERTDGPVADGAVSRTWMWGPGPISEPFNEEYSEAPDGKRMVQYFDKSRMEITNPDADPNSDWYVTNGLLVNELMSGRMQVGDSEFVDRMPAEVNVAGDADDPTGPTYETFSKVTDAPMHGVDAVINERIDRAGNVSVDDSLELRGVRVGYEDDVTKHAVAEPFWDFMNSEGLVKEEGKSEYSTDKLFENPYFATGRPVTEPYWANVKVGGEYRDVLIQAFERRVLTYTPDNPEGWQVEAGNVGQHYKEWRYGEQEPCEVPFPREIGDLEKDNVKLYNKGDLIGLVENDGENNWEDISRIAKEWFGDEKFEFYFYDDPEEVPEHPEGVEQKYDDNIDWGGAYPGAESGKQARINIDGVWQWHISIPGNLSSEYKFQMSGNLTKDMFWFMYAKDDISKLIDLSPDYYQDTSILHNDQNSALQVVLNPNCK